MLRFVRTLDGHADVFGLLIGHRRQLTPNLFEMEPCYLLIQIFGQNVHFVLIHILILPEIYLSEGLIRETVGHHETRVTSGTSQID